jgi:hypothetical protein
MLHGSCSIPQAQSAKVNYLSGPGQTNASQLKESVPLNPARPALSQTMENVLEDQSKPESLHIMDNKDSSSWRYSRSFILPCKSSSSTLRLLGDLQTLVDLGCRRRLTQDVSSRQPRAIGLPTKITIKTIKSTSVPSSLLEEGVNGQRQLCGTLNAIRNRVSDGNLMETIADIEKLEHTSPNHWQLVDNLISQRSICQSKYCEVFASHCRHLQ